MLWAWGDYSEPQNVDFYETAANTMPADGNWHHIAVTLDTNAETAAAALDGSALSWDVNNPNGSSWTIPWHVVASQEFQWVIAGGFDGNLAEVYVNNQDTLGTDSGTLGWLRNNVRGTALNLGFSTPANAACHLPHASVVTSTAEVCIRGGPEQFLRQLNADNNVSQDWTFLCGTTLELQSLEAAAGEEDPCNLVNASVPGCQDFNLIP